MPEADDANREPQEAGPGPARRGFPFKPALIVLVALCLQVGIIFLVFQLYRSAHGDGQHQGGEPSAAGPAPGASLSLADLGTFNITQFQKGDPVNRRQLSVSVAVAVDKEDAENARERLLEQKVWIAQLVDEVIGPLPLDAVHSSERERLKRQLKARINQRIGEDVAQDVILRIQVFGP